MTEISNNQEIVLQDGVWDFLAISWDGAEKFTGDNRCASSIGTDIRFPTATVNLTLLTSNCLQAGVLQQEVFGDIFQTATPSAFKTLSIHTCDVIDQTATGCLVSGTAPLTNSVRVVVPLDKVNDTAAGFVSSACYTMSPVTTEEKSSVTTVKIPGYTSLAGPTSPIISLHTSTDCSDTDPVDYILKDGLFPHEDQVNGNFSLISDIDNSAANEIKVFLEHNLFTSSDALGLELVSSDLPASATDHASITSIDIELANLYDNDIVKIYFNDSTCSDETIGLIGSVNIGVGPLNLNTVALSYSGIPFSGTAGNFSYFVKVLTSVGSNHLFSEGTSCKLIDTVVDPVSPISPSTLSWAETTPFNAVGVTSNWIISGSTDVVSQRVDIYTDSGCSVLDSSNPVSGVATSYGHTGADGNTYYFKVSATDLAGNTTSSACSGAMEIDITAPVAPMAGSWLEATPTNITSVNAQWILSGSADVNTQVISYYSDTICTTATGGPITLSNVVTTDNFTGGVDGTYSYTVSVTDYAGNSSTSACSSVLEIDTVAPPAATLTANTKVGWVEGTNVSFPTPANSTWTPSSSPDVASQEVKYYYQSGCATSTSLFSSSPLAAASTTDSFGGAAATAFRFKVITTDNAGNQSESACSDIMTIL